MTDLLTLLNQHSSRRAIDEIVALIVDDQKLFDQTVALSFTLPYPMNMHASWAIAHCCEQNPAFIQRHLDDILLKLNSTLAPGLKRNYIRIFAKQAELASMEQLGRLIDLCFTFFNDPAETIAVRAFCLDVLLKVGASEPDLIPEIIQSIEFNQAHFSTGLQSKSRKVLAKFSKVPKF